MVIKYENASGDSVFFDGQGIKLREADFFKRIWSPEKTDNGYEPKKEPVEYKITLEIVGYGAEKREILNQLFETIEKDTISGNKGKLHVGEWHLNCFISEAKSYPAESPIGVLQNLVAFSEDGIWTRESSVTIPVTTDPEGNGLYYDYTYDYTYGSSGLSITIENEHFAPCNFKLTAHGPFNNLEFAINGNLYRVNQSCAEGEMLVLDTSARTIVKVDTYGNVWNVFGKQDFTLDNFKQIPAGENVLSYGRTYQIDLTLYEERSEPKWSAW